jgi:hypothetical protein
MAGLAIGLSVAGVVALIGGAAIYRKCVHSSPPPLPRDLPPPSETAPKEPSYTTVGVVVGSGAVTAATPFMGGGGELAEGSISSGGAAAGGVAVLVGGVQISSEICFVEGGEAKGSDEGQAAVDI